MADFLEDVLSSAEPVAPDEAAQAPEPAQAVEASPEPAAPASEPSPEPARPEPGYVPIATLMDERDKRKAAEARAQQYAPQEQRYEAPDPLDDPQGFAMYQQGLVQQAIVADRFERSNEEAVEKYGEEGVAAAIEWATAQAQSKPGFAAEYMAKTRPVDWIVRQHKQSAMLSEIGDVTSVDDWFTREAAKRGYALQGAPIAAAPVAAVQPASKPAAPPRSIASDQGSPAPVAMDSKAEFEAIFNRR